MNYISRQMHSDLKIQVCGLFNPDQLTKLISITPTSVTHSGSTFPGTHNQGSYRYSYWNLRIDIEKDGDAFSAVREALLKFMQHQERWIDFIEQHDLTASLVGDVNLNGDSLSVVIEHDLSEIFYRLRLIIDFSVRS